MPKGLRYHPVRQWFSLMASGIRALLFEKRLRRGHPSRGL